MGIDAIPPPASGLPARLVLGPALRAQSDRRLVRLVREGYESAFEEIVRRYRRPLDRFAESIVGGRSEDVTQDSFRKALEALRGGDAEVELRPWLYRIVRNTALNDLRDRPPAAAELAEELIGGGHSAAFEAEQREEVATLVERLRGLPERQRAALVMRELEGMGHEEIAAALGISGGAARQAIARGRAAMRSGLGALVPLPLLRAMASGDPGVEAAAGGATGVGAAAGGALGGGGGGAAAGGALGGGGGGAALLGGAGALKVGLATVVVAGGIGAGVAIEHGGGHRRADASVRAATEAAAPASDGSRVTDSSLPPSAALADVERDDSADDGSAGRSGDDGSHRRDDRHPGGDDSRGRGGRRHDGEEDDGRHGRRGRDGHGSDDSAAAITAAPLTDDRDRSHRDDPGRGPGGSDDHRSRSSDSGGGDRGSGSHGGSGSRHSGSSSDDFGSGSRQGGGADSGSRHGGAPDDESGSRSRSGSGSGSGSRSGSDSEGTSGSRHGGSSSGSGSGGSGSGHGGGSDGPSPAVSTAPAEETSSAGPEASSGSSGSSSSGSSGSDDGPAAAAPARSTSGSSGGPSPVESPVTDDRSGSGSGGGSGSSDDS